MVRRCSCSRNIDESDRRASIKPAHQGDLPGAERAITVEPNRHCLHAPTARSGTTAFHRQGEPRRQRTGLPTKTSENCRFDMFIADDRTLRSSGRNNRLFVDVILCRGTALNKCHATQANQCDQRQEDAQRRIPFRSLVARARHQFRHKKADEPRGEQQHRPADGQERRHQ